MPPVQMSPEEYFKRAKASATPASEVLTLQTEQQAPAQPQIVYYYPRDNQMLYLFGIVAMVAIAGLAIIALNQRR